jgi:MFS family permease
VRFNQYADMVAAMVFGPFVAGLGFISVVLRNLGASPEWLALYSAQPFIGNLLAPFTVVFMPRQKGLRLYAVMLWAISRGSFLLFAFANSWQAIMAVTFLFWILEAVPGPAYVRIMQLVFPAKVRGQVMANVRVGMALLSLVVTPVAGVLLDGIGPQAFFPLTSLFALGTVALFSRLRVDESELPAAAPRSAGQVWQVLGRDRRFATYLVGMVFFGLGYLSGGALQPLVQVDQLGLSYTEVGALSTVNSVFFFIGYLFFGRWIDRYGGVQMLRVVLLVSAVIPFSYALAAGLLPSFWTLVPAFSALGFMSAGLDLGVLNAVIQLARPEDVGDYSALQMSVLGLRGLIASFLGVWLNGAGLPLPWVFALGGVAILIGAVILWRLEVPQPGS